jgi:hypothetical protein
MHSMVESSRPGLVAGTGPPGSGRDVAMNSRIKSAAIAAVGSLGTVLVTLAGAHAVRPDECEQQRKLYPEVWADVSQE